MFTKPISVEHPVIIWLISFNSFFYFLKILFFREVLVSKENWEKGTEIFPSTSSPHPHVITPIISISHWNGTFITVDGPVLAQHTPKVCSLPWCCTFYVFGQTYNDIYLSLKCHTKCFRCPKNPLCSAFPSPHLQSLATTDLFSLHSFAFFPNII